MNIKLNRRRLELSKADGMGLVDLIAGVRAAASQGWRPWCERCAQPGLYIVIRLAQRLGFLCVACRGHTHRELIEASDVHGATRIWLLPLRPDRSRIVSASWDVVDLQNAVQSTLVAPDDIALSGESLLSIQGLAESRALDVKTVPGQASAPSLTCRPSEGRGIGIPLIDGPLANVAGGRERGAPVLRAQTTSRRASHA
jgi:hypothetical protein